MVKVPTLVIWGEQDRVLITSNLEGLEKFVPLVTIKRIPDCAHWVIHQKPALVNTAIQEFIDDHSSRREASALPKRRSSVLCTMATPTRVFRL
jgi:hypothetical protein